MATPEPAKEAPKPSAVPRNRCFHRGWVVNAQKRELNCQECGSPMDPFDALADIASNYEQVKAARAEHRELLRLNGELLDEEKLVKARTKAASRKDAAVAVAANNAKWEERMYRTNGNASLIVELAQKIQRAAKSPKT